MGDNFNGCFMKICLSLPTAKRARSLWLAMVMLWLPLSGQWVMAEPQMLNFNQADIRSVIATIGEVTGKTFVIDPRVQGEVTVISNKALEEDELYGVFLSVLRVQGYAAITDGDVVRIVPDAVAQQQAASSGGNAYIYY